MSAGRPVFGYVTVAPDALAAADAIVARAQRIRTALSGSYTTGSAVAQAKATAGQLAGIAADLERLL